MEVGALEIGALEVGAVVSGALQWQLVEHFFAQFLWQLFALLLHFFSHFTSVHLPSDSQMAVGAAVVGNKLVGGAVVGVEDW